ncbi:MAG: D-alanine--D-alanine ligase [Alphaproteobacteria bacterium]
MDKMLALKIILLQGGWSAERSVSLETGAAIHQALLALGHQVIVIDPPRDAADFCNALKNAFDGQCQLVFNGLHGPFGEDGHVQALCGLLGLPITHSGLLSSAMAMNKHVTRQILQSLGLPIAAGRIETAARINSHPPLPFPFVIKALNEGSSVGVWVVKTQDDMPDLEQYGNQEFLVEEYIAGREFTVAVLGGKALAVTELIPNQGFYDFDAKYSQGATQHICPAKIDDALYERCMVMAETAHFALDCKGLTRTDFRYDDTNIKDAPARLVILEINTQPGMTALSLAPEQAASKGISFDQLIDWIIKDALK